jgi:hypothetical protein
LTDLIIGAFAKSINVVEADNEWSFVKDVKGIGGGKFYKILCQPFSIETKNSRKGSLPMGRDSSTKQRR